MLRFNILFPMQTYLSLLRAQDTLLESCLSLSTASAHIVYEGSTPAHLGQKMHSKRNYYIPLLIYVHSGHVTQNRGKYLKNNEIINDQFSDDT